jgi:hypothetical protein
MTGPHPYAHGIHDGYCGHAPSLVLAYCPDYWRGYAAGMAIAMGARR